MEPRIEKIAEKKLVGKRIKMSLSNDLVFELWYSFMPERFMIKNNAGTELYDMNIFDATLEFKDFSTETEFEKWAAVEVTDFEDVPESMETYVMKGGLYAVFVHKGDFSTFANTMKYIYETWLPASNYIPDNREQFQILGEKYKNNDPDSEEEVWIPIKTIDN